jgi:anti-sigma factor ChrR (cupin superfamily)
LVVHTVSTFTGGDRLLTAAKAVAHKLRRKLPRCTVLSDLLLPARASAGELLPHAFDMYLNADLTQRAVLAAEQHRWVPSPQPGVERVMLDRMGAEQGRVTSLVRYAPRSVFPSHTHPGGEEVLVLSGTFADGSGEHGPGCYLRNPPGSMHQPSSPDGALIFVKLWQMTSREKKAVRINTRDSAAWRLEGERRWCQLYVDAREHVRLERLPPGARLPLDTQGGAELLVLEGGVLADGLWLGECSWLRLPPGDACMPRAGDGGCLVYVKTGHLAEATA